MPEPSRARPPERAVELAAGSPYFCGESSFFSLHLALQTIAREKLTGTLRAFLARDSVELVARDGEVVVVTTRNPSLYCQETPATLLNVDDERIEAARARQAVDGCPMFITLAREGLILDEPGIQLAQHYGQRFFSQLSNCLCLRLLASFSSRIATGRLLLRRSREAGHCATRDSVTFHAPVRRTRLKGGETTRWWGLSSRLAVPTVRTCRRTSPPASPRSAWPSCAVTAHGWLRTGWYPRSLPPL